MWLLRRRGAEPRSPSRPRLICLRSGPCDYGRENKVEGDERVERERVELIVEDAACQKTNHGGFQAQRNRLEIKAPATGLIPALNCGFRAQAPVPPHKIDKNRNENDDADQSLFGEHLDVGVVHHLAVKVGGIRVEPSRFSILEVLRGINSDVAGSDSDQG